MGGTFRSLQAHKAQMGLRGQPLLARLLDVKHFPCAASHTKNWHLSWGRVRAPWKLGEERLDVGRQHSSTVEAEAAEKQPLAVQRQFKVSGWSGVRCVCCTVFQRVENWTMEAADRLALKCRIHLSPSKAALTVIVLSVHCLNRSGNFVWKLSLLSQGSVQN